MNKRRRALVPAADEILFTDPVDLAAPVRMARRGNPKGSPAPKWKLDPASLSPYQGAEKFLVRTAIVRASGWRENLPKIVTSSRSIVTLCQHLAHADVEYMVVFVLSVKQEILAIYEVAVGSHDGVGVEIQHLLKVPLLVGGYAVVMVHNHPSGYSDPSPEDLAFTRRAVDGLHCIGVALLDHVIVAARSNYSFLDAGILPSPPKG